MTVIPTPPAQPGASETAVPAWRSLYPFASQYLKLADGCSYHYVDEGTGEPVLLLHGNPSWSFLFRDVIRDLRGHCRAIAPDHLGCGLSDKPQDYPYRLENHIANLEALVIGKLNLPRFSLVLHDWGGAIGMGLATRYPERVAKIVVMNTAAFLLPRCPWRIRLCRVPGFGALAVRGFNAFARAALHMAVAEPQRLSPVVRAGFLAPYDTWRNRIATLRFVQDIPLSPRHPTRQVLIGIEERLPLLAEKPMLICWGEKDFCFGEPFLQTWLRHFPRATLHRFPEAGHYLLEDAGAQIVPLIRNFLCRT